MHLWGAFPFRLCPTGTMSLASAELAEREMSKILWLASNSSLASGVLAANFALNINGSRHHRVCLAPAAGEEQPKLLELLLGICQPTSIPYFNLAEKIKELLDVRASRGRISFSGFASRFRFLIPISLYMLEIQHPTR